MCHHSSKVFEVIRTISSLFIYLFFFLRKDFKRTKTRHKQKPTNKTKLSKQKATKATFFRTHKNSKRGKLFVLRFGAFFYYWSASLSTSLWRIIFLLIEPIIFYHTYLFFICAHLFPYSHLCALVLISKNFFSLW